MSRIPDRCGRQHNRFSGLLLLLMACAGTAPAGAPAEAAQSVRIAVELVDSVACWCSPLWGHNAPKIVEGKNGEVWIAIFSGAYPEAQVQIVKRTAAGGWERGKVFHGAYQPSLLFVDEAGRLNVIQNSQTHPIIHFRSTDDNNLNNFEVVAEGNGQEDGRGWYVGAGVLKDTVYMAYVTLSYDLFLTWKPVTARQWNPAVLIHKGSVDTVVGNHSWTRPRFQFSGRTGMFVVNETSDGSVKNTYNAVQLVTFDRAHPDRFTTECLGRVPQGFGMYSPDFAALPDGRTYTVMMRNGRLYDSPFSSDPTPAVLLAFRAHATGEVSVSAAFGTLSDAALHVDSAGTVTALRVSAGEPARPTGSAVKTSSTSIRAASWAAARPETGGTGWVQVPVEASPLHVIRPSHMQIATGANNWGGRPGRSGVFVDEYQSGRGERMFRYYVFTVNPGSLQ